MFRFDVARKGVDEDSSCACSVQESSEGVTEGGKRRAFRRAPSEDGSFDLC